MSVLGTILPNSKLVPPHVKQARMAICNSCPFKKSLTGSCGTLFLGEWVFYNGMQKKLCGCIVNEKTELPGECCPIDKWGIYNK